MLHLRHQCLPIIPLTLGACRPFRRVITTALLAIISPLATWAEPMTTTAETIVLFDPDALETPESIVFDRSDKAYISLAFTGEVRRVASDGSTSTLSFLPIGAPCADPRSTVLLGLAIDRHDRLYGAVNACDPLNQGIWKISTSDGTIEKIASLPADVVGNGIDIFRNEIYIADTFGGRVFRVSQFGGTPEVWADDPLLAQDLNGLGPGPNGVRVFQRVLYVANSSTAQIIAIPIGPNGTAGTPSVYVDLPNGQGCDEFVFDVRGSLYCTTDPLNTVVRVNRDGSGEVLLTAADLLDGPTSVAFGRRGQNRKNLYITNAAFPFFTQTFRPSLMRLRLDVAGAP